MSEKYSGMKWKVEPGDLKAIDTPSGGELPSYNALQGLFEWAPGIWEEIGDIELTEAAASISFDGLSADYKRFLVVVQSWHTHTAPRGIIVRFNDDDGANYSDALIEMSGTTLTGFNETNMTGINFAMGDDDAGVGALGFGIISNYRSDIYKTLWGGGFKTTGLMYWRLSGGSWNNTTDNITKITLSWLGSGDPIFQAKSRVWLLGVK